MGFAGGILALALVSLVQGSPQLGATTPEVRAETKARRPVPVHLRVHHLTLKLRLNHQERLKVERLLFDEQARARAAGAMIEPPEPLFPGEKPRPGLPVQASAPTLPAAFASGQLSRMHVVLRDLPPRTLEALMRLLPPAKHPAYRELLGDEGVWYLRGLAKQRRLAWGALGGRPAGGVDLSTLLSSPGVAGVGFGPGAGGTSRGSDLLRIFEESQAILKKEKADRDAQLGADPFADPTQQGQGRKGRRRIF